LRESYLGLVQDGINSISVIKELLGEHTHLEGPDETVLGVVPSNPSDKVGIFVEVSLAALLLVIAELVGSVVVSTILLGDGSALRSFVDDKVETLASIPGLEFVPKSVVVGV
jgi:hypothetical protein